AQEAFEAKTEMKNRAGLGIVVHQTTDLPEDVGNAGLAEQTVDGVVSAPRIGDEDARKNCAENVDDDRRAPIGGGVIVGGGFTGEGPQPPIDSANTPAGFIGPNLKTLSDIPKDFF